MASSKGNINLNCLLINVPSYVRKYVIVHELAHRKEMNHSERFGELSPTRSPNTRRLSNGLSRTRIR